MLLIGIISVAFLMLSVVVLFGVWYVHVKPWRKVVKSRVVVALINGDSLEGVLLSRVGKVLELSNVTLLKPGYAPIPIDDVYYIETDRILWINKRSAKVD